MDSSRREILRLCGALCGVGLAGCSSQDDSITYPTDEATGTPTVTGTSAPTSERPTTEPPETTEESTAEPTETEPEPSPTPAEHGDLAVRTETIIGEIQWFATEYEGAISNYRNAINRLLRTIEQVRDSADISTHDLERLHNGTETVARVTQQEIAPHFDVSDRLLTPENDYYRTVEKFANRGDWDRADEELSEMHTFYETRQREYVIDEELSADPVQGRLLSSLRADSISNDFRRRNDVTKGVDPALFELYYPGASYRSFAYSEEPSMIYGDPIDHRDINAFRTFEGLEEDGGRTARAYVTADLVSRRSPRRWTHELPDDVVFLQAYTSSSAASRAVERMIQSSVSQEGTETLGGRPWQRVYYYYDGDIVYAYLLRAGRFLLAASPSRTAWEERSEYWSDPLELTWLWS